MQRDNDNRKLFFTTIEYWSCILAFTIFLFLCECIYNYYKMKDSKNIVPYDDESTENELVSINNYRKNSIDEEELGMQLKELKKEDFVCVLKNIYTLYYFWYQYNYFPIFIFSICSF